MNRRKFLINNSKAALGITLIPAAGFSMADNVNFKKYKSKSMLILAKYMPMK